MTTKNCPVRTKENECYKCANMREVPGNCHIKCIDPDPTINGCKYAVRNGWFFYPLLFDPVWKEKTCANFKEK